MGPLINSAAVSEAVDSGLFNPPSPRGQDLPWEESVRRGSTKGISTNPPILTNVTDEMRVFAEENFGPVAAITSFNG